MALPPPCISKVSLVMINKLNPPASVVLGSLVGLRWLHTVLLTLGLLDVSKRKFPEEAPHKWIIWPPLLVGKWKLLNWQNTPRGIHYKKNALMPSSLTLIARCSQIFSTQFKNLSQNSKIAMILRQLQKIFFGLYRETILGTSKQFFEWIPCSAELVMTTLRWFHFI